MRDSRNSFAQPCIILQIKTLFGCLLCLALATSPQPFYSVFKYGHAIRLMIKLRDVRGMLGEFWAHIAFFWLA